MVTLVVMVGSSLIQPLEILDVMVDSSSLPPMELGLVMLTLSLSALLAWFALALRSRFSSLMSLVSSQLDLSALSLRFLGNSYVAHDH